MYFFKKSSSKTGGWARSLTGSIGVWFKFNRAWVIFWGGLILLFLTSFGVGYLVGQEKNQTPIIIEQHSE